MIEHGGVGEHIPVVEPHVTLDTKFSSSGSHKLVLMDWAQGTEDTLAQQFFHDGPFNASIIPKVARALALINQNRSAVDADFNDTMRTYVKSSFAVMKPMFAQKIGRPETENDDALIREGRKLGAASFDQMIDAIQAEYDTDRTVFSHGDPNPFNILANANGDPFYLCDWESSVKGPLGRDAGIFQAWPIAFALCHASHGRRQAAVDRVEAVCDFWDAYAKALVYDGDDAVTNDGLVQARRTALGSCSLFLLPAFYILGVFAEHLPLDGLSDNSKKRTMGSIGLVGLVFFWCQVEGREVGSGRSLSRVPIHTVGSC